MLGMVKIELVGFEGNELWSDEQSLSIAATWTGAVTCRSSQTNNASSPKTGDIANETDSGHGPPPRRFIVDVTGPCPVIYPDEHQRLPLTAAHRKLRHSPNANSHCGHILRHPKQGRSHVLIRSLRDPFFASNSSFQGQEDATF
jgi:hypothetical protein